MILRIFLALVLVFQFRTASAAEYVTVRKPPASRYDPLTTAQLKALVQQGITVVDDYGPFALATSASPVDTATVAKITGLVVVNEPTYNKIAIGGAEIDTRPGHADVVGIAPNLRMSDYPAGADGLYLVQFAGPPKPEWLREIGNSGATTIRYVDTNAYIVRAPAGLGALKAKMPASVKFVATYEPFAKLAPALRAPGEGAIRLLAVWDQGETLESVRAKSLALDPSAHVDKSIEGYSVLRATRGQAAILAADPHVLSIEEAQDAMPSDERTAQIAAGNISGNGASGAGQYLSGLETACYSCFHDMSTESVAVVDTGLYAHADLTGGQPGRLKDAAAFLGVTGTVDAYFHGTFVAGVIGGNPLQGGGTSNSGDGGFYWGMGVAPTVKLVNTRIFDNNGGAVGTWSPDGMDALTAHAYNNGAAVQNNSWNFCASGYTAYSRRFDLRVRDATAVGNVAEGIHPLTIVFSSGNTTNCGAAPVVAPATAKNVIAVGASSFARPALGGGCDLAGGINDVSAVSTRGVAGAGARIKPDLVAASTSSVSTLSATHNGNGCNGQNTIGAGAYYADLGTSFSAPLVSGAAILLKRRIGGSPSPALTKAFLLGTAASVSGGTDRYDTSVLGWEPAPRQGFGRLDLSSIINASPSTRYLDEDHEGSRTRRFTSTGQYYEVTYNVADYSKPVVIVLAYTDAPSDENSVGNAVNVLNMVAYNQYGWSWHDGSTGAQFTPPCTPPGLSAPCWIADSVNNVKWIKIDPYVLPYPSFTVQVVASAIAAKAVPGLDAGANQDWALYVYNAY